MALLEYEENPKHKDDKEKSDLYESCDCPPSCTDISYRSEISNSRWNWRPYFKSRNILLDNRTEMSSLSIYFKATNFLAMRRNELYSTPDLIASFAGLLSLFTGVSVITVLELLYFFTLRLIYNKKLYGKYSIGSGKKKREYL